MRQRVQAGLEQLKSNPDVDTGRIAAIGYCFGGTTALELGRSGADIAGIVTFHAGLSNPSPEDAKNIKARLLVLQGANDPLAKPADVDKFEDEMRATKVDWQFVSYGGAVHGFSNPKNKDPEHGSCTMKRSISGPGKRCRISLRRFLRRSRPPRRSALRPQAFEQCSAGQARLARAMLWLKKTPLKFPRNSPSTLPRPTASRSSGTPGGHGPRDTDEPEGR